VTVQTALLTLVLATPLADVTVDVATNLECSQR